MDVIFAVQDIAEVAVLYKFFPEAFRDKGKGSCVL